MLFCLTHFIYLIYQLTCICHKMTLHFNCNDLDIVWLLYSMFFVSLIIHLLELDKMSLECWLERTFYTIPWNAHQERHFNANQVPYASGLRIVSCSFFGIKAFSSSFSHVGYCKSLVHLKEVFQKRSPPKMVNRAYSRSTCLVYIDAAVLWQEFYNHYVLQNFVAVSVLIHLPCVISFVCVSAWIGYSCIQY